MDAAAEAAFLALLAAQPIAALGTLRSTRASAALEPFVSMVPVVWLPGGAGAVIHVSALALHTRDLLEHPRVSLMLIAPRLEGDNPQALARVTLQADAARVDPGTPAHAQAGSAYLQRFPQAAQTFALADFSLFHLVPSSGRFVAGFGRAHTIGADDFRRLVAGR